MPNHCESDLWISGKAADVKEILAHIGAEGEKPRFDFNKVIQYPEKYAQMDREIQEAEADEDKIFAYSQKWGTQNDGYNSGGYDWCVQNWGTKWGAYDVSLIFPPGRQFQGSYDRVTARLSFATAWAPPIPVVRQLRGMFPKVGISLEYFESGACFCGGISIGSDDDYEDGILPTWQEWKSKYNGVRGY